MENVYKFDANKFRFGSNMPFLSINWTFVLSIKEAIDNFRNNPHTNKLKEESWLLRDNTSGKYREYPFPLNPRT